MHHVQSLGKDSLQGHNIFKAGKEQAVPGLFGLHVESHRSPSGIAAGYLSQSERLQLRNVHQRPACARRPIPSRQMPHLRSTKALQAS